MSSLTATWGPFVPQDLRSGPLACSHRAANEDPEHVAEIRDQISQMTNEQILHCMRLAMDILTRDRTPLSKTRGMLMLNVLREQRIRRNI